jgi:hypothetical protein
MQGPNRVGEEGPKLITRKPSHTHTQTHRDVQPHAGRHRDTDSENERQFTRASPEHLFFQGFSIKNAGQAKAATSNVGMQDCRHVAQYLISALGVGAKKVLVISMGVI